MGHLPDSTPEMGEYSVEVRRESFYLKGEYLFDPEQGRYVKHKHAITVYENGDCGQGTVEILIEDIPKIRAALDLVEKTVAES